MASKNPGVSPQARPRVGHFWPPMRRRSRAAGTAVSTQDWKTGGRRIALSDLYMRSFDRPFGCFRLRPPYARDPQGPDWPPHGLCLPLAEGSLGGAVSEKVSGKPPNSLTSRTVSGLPPGLVPDAETSFRTAGADPSPVCRCAPRLPMKGHGQGKGWWRAVDKIDAEWRDLRGLAQRLSNVQAKYGCRRLTERRPTIVAIPRFHG